MYLESIFYFIFDLFEVIIYDVLIHFLYAFALIIVRKFYIIVSCIHIFLLVNIM